MNLPTVVFIHTLNIKLNLDFVLHQIIVQVS